MAEKQQRSGGRFESSDPEKVSTRRKPATRPKVDIPVGKRRIVYGKDGTATVQRMAKNGKWAKVASGKFPSPGAAKSLLANLDIDAKPAELKAKIAEKVEGVTAEKAAEREIAQSRVGQTATNVSPEEIRIAKKDPLLRTASMKELDKRILRIEGDLKEAKGSSELRDLRAELAAVKERKAERLSAALDRRAEAETSKRTAAEQADLRKGYAETETEDIYRAAKRKGEPITREQARAEQAKRALQRENQSARAMAEEAGDVEAANDSLAESKAGQRTVRRASDIDAPPRSTPEEIAKILDPKSSRTKVANFDEAVDMYRHYGALDDQPLAKALGRPYISTKNLTTHEQSVLAKIIGDSEEELYEKLDLGEDPGPEARTGAVNRSLQKSGLDPVDTRAKPPVAAPARTPASPAAATPAGTVPTEELTMATPDDLPDNPFMQAGKKLADDAKGGKGESPSAAAPFAADAADAAVDAATPASTGPWKVKASPKGKVFTIEHAKNGHKVNTNSRAKAEEMVRLLNDPPEKLGRAKWLNSPLQKRLEWVRSEAQKNVDNALAAGDAGSVAPASAAPAAGLDDAVTARFAAPADDINVGGGPFSDVASRQQVGDIPELRAPGADQLMLDKLPVKTRIPGVPDSPLPPGVKKLPRPTNPSPLAPGRTSGLASRLGPLTPDGPGGPLDFLGNPPNNPLYADDPFRGSKVFGNSGLKAKIPSIGNVGNLPISDIGGSTYWGDKNAQNLPRPMQNPPNKTRIPGVGRPSIVDSVLAPDATPPGPGVTPPGPGPRTPPGPGVTPPGTPPGTPPDLGPTKTSLMDRGKGLLAKGGKSLISSPSGATLLKTPSLMGGLGAGLAGQFAGGAVSGIGEGMSQDPNNQGGFKQDVGQFLQGAGDTGKWAAPLFAMGPLGIAAGTAATVGGGLVNALWGSERTKEDDFSDALTGPLVPQENTDRYMAMYRMNVESGMTHEEASQAVLAKAMEDDELLQAQAQEEKYMVQPEQALALQALYAEDMMQLANQANGFNMVAQQLADENAKGLSPANAKALRYAQAIQNQSQQAIMNNNYANLYLAPYQQMIQAQLDQANALSGSLATRQKSNLVNQLLPSQSSSGGGTDLASTLQGMSQFAQ